MFGQISWTQSVVISASVIVVVTDITKGKIYNWLTLPLIFGGLIYSTHTLGFWNSLWGIVVGLLLYGWMFWLNYLGGGDVKFLMALGAWGGHVYVENVALLAILIGGVISAIALIVTGQFSDFCRRMINFILSLTVKELEPMAPEINRKLTLPFGIPLSIAAVFLSFFPELGPLKYLW